MSFLMDPDYLFQEFWNPSDYPRSVHGEKHNVNIYWLEAEAKLACIFYENFGITVLLY